MILLKHAINTLFFFELSPSSVSGLLRSYCMFSFFCWLLYCIMSDYFRKKVMLVLSNFDFFTDLARFSISPAWFAIETQGSRIATLNQVAIAKKVAKGGFFCGFVHAFVVRCIEIYSGKCLPVFLSSSEFSGWPPLIIMMSHFKKNLSDFFLMNVAIF